MKRSLFFICYIIISAISAYSPRSVSASVNIAVIGSNAVYDYGSPEIKADLFGARVSGKSEIIKDISDRENIPAKNAEIKFSPDEKNVFSFEKESDGIEVDEEYLLDELNAALSIGGGAVSIRYKTVRPTVTENELRTQTFERARFTTYFANSSPERINNVMLAAKSVSGSVVESGETFSFNRAVGERSKERGYKTAKIIKDGKFEDGLGGGVCQVSTTLYNAALLSGLEIAEYHPHSLAVSYVENSFDAMVSFGSADLKIKNVTDGKIFIAAYVYADRVTFVIFGEKNPYEIERCSVTEKIVRADEETIYSEDLLKGETNVKVKAKDGAVSKGYLIVKKGGKSYKKLLRSDSYGKVDGVIEKGVREKSNSLA